MVANESEEDDDVEAAKGEAEDESTVEEKEEAEQARADTVPAPRRSPRLHSTREDSSTVQSHPRDLLQTMSEK